MRTWKNAPSGKVLKGDIGIAKNCLIEKEIKELERVVTMYLDFAELQASRQIPMKMEGLGCQGRWAFAIQRIPDFKRCRKGKPQSEA